MKQVSPIIPPSPFRNADPPTRNAELTVFSLGPDQDALIPCLRMLGQFSEQRLRRFQHSLPCVMTLPASYYDKSNPFVSLLRTTGTKFRIRSWPWVCPEEIKDAHHWCSGTCSIVQIEEEVGS